MAAVMGYVHEHGEQHFASGKTAVGRVVDFVELLVGLIWDDRETIFKRAAQELDDGAFVLVGGEGRVGVSASLRPAQKA